MYQSIATHAPARAISVKKSTVSNTSEGVFERFYKWTVQQETKRIKWLAFTFVLQVGLALPCALLTVVFLGNNNFNLWLVACVFNVPSFALSLAAQPTKVTLPALFLAWLADAAIIIYCFASFFMHS
ncbi:MAG TPA: hypothetical protein VG738_09525 [Chitinophagaceae bacterium]|nr:hypothetical protein [Chitinophagaceae bacterium]